MHTHKWNGNKLRVNHVTYSLRVEQVSEKHVSKAIYQLMERFYGAQPGGDPDKAHCIV